MKFGSILSNLGQISSYLQFAEAMAGHSNVTLNEIAQAVGEISGSEAAVLAGKAVKTLTFTESENGQPTRLTLYAVLEGGHADQVISSTLV